MRMLHSDEGRRRSSYTVLQQLSSSVLLPYDGHYGCGRTSGRHGNGNAWRQHPYESPADPPDCDGRRSEICDPRRRPHGRRRRCIEDHQIRFSQTKEKLPPDRREFFCIFYNSRFCTGYNTKMSAYTSSGRNMFKPFCGCVSLRLPEGFSCAAHKSKGVNRRQKKKKGREKQKREKRGKREEKARKDKKKEKEERRKRRERSRKQRIKNLQ